MTALRVLVDAHMVGQRETGNETYVRGLLSGLRQLPDLRVAAAVQAGVTLPAELTTGGVDLLPLRSSSNWWRLAWGLEAECRRWEADLLHVTFIAPPRCSRPVAVTVHDVSFRRYPEFFSTRDRLLFATLLPLSLRRASAVLTDSEHARQEIAHYFPLLKTPVSVVPLGVSGRFHAKHNTTERVMVQNRYGTAESYILAVGNLQPRKNLAELVRAFATVHDRFPEMRLVVAGQAQRRSSRLLPLAESMGVARHVVFPGYVPQDDLGALYRCASVFVHPSIYEGFGLPILEAMACDTPVVALNASSVPEVVEDAALLTDPATKDGLASAICQVLEDRDLAHQLVARGRERVKRFSWRATAQKTTEVYRSISGKRRLPG